MLRDVIGMLAVIWDSSWDQHDVGLSLGVTANVAGEKNAAFAQDSCKFLALCSRKMNLLCCNFDRVVNVINASLTIMCVAEYDSAQTDLCSRIK
jgi:hypothetical protein